MSRAGRLTRSGSLGWVLVLALLVSLAGPAGWGLDPAAAEPGHAAPATGPGQAAAADDRWLVTLDAPVDGARFVAEVGAEAVGDPVRSRVQVVRFPDRQSRDEGLRRLDARPDVAAVEPDAEVEVSFEPNPAWWHLHNDGQRIGGTFGRPNIDLGVDAAWPHADGHGVVIALIDSGVDIDHPNLRGQLWRNPRGGPDLHGWNFVDGDERLYHGPSVDAHGTHVAGILVGARDPQLGVSGIAPGARVMVLRFMEGDTGRISDAIAAIHYAAANGAHIINASWTTPQPRAALRAALVESGLLVVAAAGNAARSLEEVPSYPTSWRLPNVVGVTAVDHQGRLAPFGATSRTLVDVGAPGTGIWSTFPEGRFGTQSGTSQSAPMVTGALALAMQRRPHPAPAELAETVRRSVRPLGSMIETRSGGILRAPSLLDATGTRIRTCTGTATSSFVDVDPGSTHERGIDCLVRSGIARGRSSTVFGAEDRLTRAQVATLLANVLDRAGELPDPPERGRFVDVPDDHVHRDSIETLAAMGLVSGRSSTRYDPGATTTRAEFAALSIRLAEHLADGGARSGTGVRFSDIAGHTHESRIRQAATARVVSGMPDGSFAPDLPVRRDQAATMTNGLLDRLLHQGLSPAT